MATHLEFDRDTHGDILRRTLGMAEKYFSKQATMAPGTCIPDIAMDVLPREGHGAMATLDFFEKEYSHRITNSAGPRYFGFVTGGSTPASIAADWLVSAYDQNACGSNDSIAPQIEKQTIHYFKQLLGLADDYYGSFVTGATMSNFVGLALGRQWLGERSGIDVANEGMSRLQMKVFSGTPHSSILKSLAMLGMGRNTIQRVDTLPDREAIDVGQLENHLRGARQDAIVVANAGTVNTGDFDDLKGIGELKKKYNFWMHVDAAFGGFAACSLAHSHLLAGLNLADSLTVDAHKWLNVPYDSAMQFTRHQSLQLKIFQNSASYLGDAAKSPDYFHYTPENSRRWRALPAWFSLRAYGKNGYRDIVERTCSMAQRLAMHIANDDGFKLLSPVRLNIVCFTIADTKADASLVQNFLQAVRADGKVFFTPTLYKGIPAIRAAVSNWQTVEKDVDMAYEAMTRVWAEIKLGLHSGI